MSSSGKICDALSYLKHLLKHLISNFVEHLLDLNPFVDRIVEVVIGFENP
ncbi:hypothetical protein Syun_008024 [Stephania yunnanensis]|uniref:Uncharacterized protein n=1 Tax=Stephania yunnanensis TaxID=152371 RepID=A0AAP0KZK6_9MAGN